MDKTKPGEVMLGKIAESPRVLRDISANMQSEKIAPNLFKTPQFNSVVILARGSSNNAGHFLKYLIEIKMELPCALASPSATTMSSTKFCFERTLVIAISQSGQSEDLLAFARAAKKGGAFFLAVINKEDSSLAKLSDVHHPIFAGRELAVPATKSYVGQLMVSYLLVMQWIHETPQSEDIAARAERLVAQDKEINDFADKINIQNPIYILGRGFSYPNAKEFALKIQETCLIPIQGMSTSDFLHGAIASLSTESQVIFISPQHLPQDLFGEAPDRVHTVTNRVF
jgi:glucosamine--fructose-6-phosphate aminotransferase (isomerizing)